MDMSVGKKGKVLVYLEYDENGSYNLHIQSDGKLYANFDMSRWFGEFSSVKFVTGLELIDTTYMVKADSMFSGFGSYGDNFNASITIRNPNVMSYNSMFYYSSINENSQLVVNYTSETSDLVDEMIATKSSNANVIKGNLVR